MGSTVYTEDENPTKIFYFDNKKFFIANVIVGQIPLALHFK
jgi:hypothetical protein